MRWNFMPLGTSSYNRVMPKNPTPSDPLRLDPEPVPKPQPEREKPSKKEKAAKKKKR